MSKNIYERQVQGCCKDKTLGHTDHRRRVNLGQTRQHRGNLLTEQSGVAHDTCVPLGYMYSTLQCAPPHLVRASIPLAAARPEPREGLGDLGDGAA